MRWSYFEDINHTFLGKVVVVGIGKSFCAGRFANEGIDGIVLRGNGSICHYVPLSIGMPELEGLLGNGPPVKLREPEIL